MLTLKPYRFEPPLSLTETSIDRPRLVEMLDGRFERRLTTLCGGPGFGKTTLLCQAIANNREDPTGIDVWLGCGPPDDRERELAVGLLTALGADPNSASPLETIVDAVWKESPRNVALVLDDVHHITPHGSGVGFLEQLLLSLPLNGHIVFASRDKAPFSTSRLAVAGEVVDVDEIMLSFDSAERSEFLGDRGAAQDADFGGWPAALELATAFGAERVGEYAWDEVLENLETRRCKALARLASLEWISDERIEAIAGDSLSAESLVENLPLTSRGADGTFRLHALWQPFLDRFDSQWTPTELDRAIAHLCDEEEHREAIVFCKYVGDHDRIFGVIRAMAGITRWVRRSTAELETVLNELPPAMRDSTVGKFVEGIFQLHTDPPAAIPLLAAARTGARDASDVEIELGALIAQGFIAFFVGSAEFLESLLEPLLEVEHSDVPSLACLSRANLDVLQGHPEQALVNFDRLQQMESRLSGVQHATAAIAALDAGRPERAIREVQKARLHSTLLMEASALTTENEARWLLGEVEIHEIAPFDGGVPDRLTGHMHNAAVFQAGLAFQNAAFGRIDPARHHIEFLRRAAKQSIGPRARIAIAAAEFIFSVLEGDPDRGCELIRRELLEALPAARYHRHSYRAMPLIWVLCPEWRERIDTLKLGPSFAEGLNAAAALVDVRDGVGGVKAAALDWRRVARFRIYFVPSMILELAIAAVAAGNNDANETAIALAENNRETLRALTSTSFRSTSAQTSSPDAVAKQLLTTIPERPIERHELRILGPIELWRGGAPVQDALLRRDRVRTILEYLVLHPSSQRPLLAAAVWPDRDETTSSNNLRVNLNHLIRLLEPDRSKDEPSFFIHTDRETIRLRIEEGLHLDSISFEQELDHARELDQDGRPAMALERLERALALYRGDLLADSAYPEWSESLRTKLRSRFIVAAQRAASLRLGKGEFEAALNHVGRAIAADHLHEAAHRLQALIYFRAGDETAARSSLRSAVEQLKAEGLTPGEDLLRLQRRVEGGRVVS